MAKRAPRIPPFIFIPVWLAVVSGAIVYAITHFEEYGAFSVIMVLLAAFMLTLFFITFLPAKMQKHPFTEGLGKWATGLLIIGAVCALGYHFVLTFGHNSFMGTVVIIFFIFIFVRILIDFIKDARKPKRTRKKSDGKDELRRNNQK